MRQLLAALAVVVCGALTAGAADDEKYASKDGKYTIQFPAGTKVKTSTSKAGDIDMYTALAESGADKAYMVMYMDLPAAVKDIPAKTILDGGQKGALDNSGGKLESAKDITFGKNKLPGREVVIVKDDNKIKCRIILADTRAYVVLVGGPKDFALTKDGTKFLDSFEITK